MISISQIEEDLTASLKAKDRLKADVLRGLKTRLQNEKIAKMKDLSEAESVALVRSEVKRRKEAAAAFRNGGREELALKEEQEAEVLSRYLPAQISEDQVIALADQIIAESGFTAKDFGKAMATLKAKAGESADSAVLAKVLKEKLTNNN